MRIFSCKSLCHRRREAVSRAQPGRGSRGIAGISMGRIRCAAHSVPASAAFRGGRRAQRGAHRETAQHQRAEFTADEPAARSGRCVRNPVRSRVLEAKRSPNDCANRKSCWVENLFRSCGSEDDYGFDVGAAALDKLLTSRHISHEFHLYPGGHNWSYFAEHLPWLCWKFEYHAFDH